MLAIAELVQQGVLTEESMDEAKQALEDHVATHLLSRQLIEKQEHDKLDATRLVHQLVHDATVQTSLSKQRSIMQIKIARTAAVAEAEELKTMQELLPTAYDARQSLNEWLETNRLARHKVHFAQVGGPESGLTDLALLTEEETGELSSVMTKMEARRFEAALKTLAIVESGQDDDEEQETVVDATAEVSPEKLSSKKSSAMTSSQL